MSCQPWNQCYMYENIIVTPNDTTLAEVNKYKIDIGFSYWYESCKNESRIIQSAYAYKPAIHNIAPEKIEYIHITSNTDFDAQHPAGTVLNDLFNIPTTIKHAPYEIPNNVILRAELIKGPTTSSMHRFKIEAKLKDSGAIMDTTLNPIMVQ